MMDVPSIRARVMFKNTEGGGRQHPPVDTTEYRPHVVIGDRNQKEAHFADDGRTLVEDYLAVVFTGDGQAMEFDKEWDVVLRLWNDAADYSGLAPGATFTIREGGQIVESGEVLDKA